MVKDVVHYSTGKQKEKGTKQRPDTPKQEASQRSSNLSLFETFGGSTSMYIYIYMHTHFLPVCKCGGADDVVVLDAFQIKLE